jgi:ABC-2 type transport system permease protein
MAARGVVGLIAKREIDSRWAQKGFRWGTLVFLLVIGAAALLPKFIGGGDGRTSYDVGIVTQGSDSARDDALRQALGSVGGAGVSIKVSDVASAADGRDQVRTSDLDAVIDGNRILARSDTDPVVGLVQAAVSATIFEAALRAAGLSDAQIADVLSAPAPSVESVETSDKAARRGIATVVVVLLFAQLIGYCSWVGLGVVEEKSSRVVELILATVRPWQLLLGKLLGIGALAVGQLLAMGAVALGVIKVSGSLSLPAGAYGAIGITFVWFVLGFAFFAAMSAALASLVSRQEEVSGVMLPVTATLMVSYFLAFVVTASSDSTLAQVVAIVPPVSSLAMPARVAGGDVPAWQIALSLVLLIVATALVLVVAARIYRAAVLHSGSRVGLRAAWKGEAAAALD